ncbi:MAG TPA: molybdopterin-dependent oxidoreductase [Candidatus Methanoperedenaceae archaeon]|nr:molybdopterin-dependent oxidoreductase [Candidatus Methanoperedenaceae archaeon]
MLSRRDFVKSALLAGGAMLGADLLKNHSDFMTRASAEPQRVAYELSRPDNILYTSCQQCNTGCPIKVKFLDSHIAKIDGNPYSPWNMFPHLGFSTPLEKAAVIDAGLCPKGQAGIQTYYDPYRITKVLKRAGKRGENRWISMDFETAVSEIVNGGHLFSHVSGEENRYVEGFKDVMALRDVPVSKEMAAEVDKIVAEKDANKKLELVSAFKEKFRAGLDKFIDPDHPDLGPKNNQIVFMWGRLKGGRSDLIRRFVKACGSVNAHGHTTVCQGSLYFTGKAMSEQYLYDAKDKKFKWAGGDKFYFQADEGNAEFILFVGTSLFEGNYGPTNRAMKVMEGLDSGRLKFVTLNPRFTKEASKAWKWIPTKPGTDAAFAWGMLRWIIENRKYDENYLRNANKKAAESAGEPTFSNASWLVAIRDGKPGKWLYGSDLGLPQIKKTVPAGDKTEEVNMDPLIVMVDGKAVAIDPYDDKNPVKGDLFVSTLLKDKDGRDIEVKSAMQLVKEESQTKSLKEWAAHCGAKESDLAEIAREFTSHGKKAVVDVHRGVSQHTNGFYNVGSWMLLNLMLGNNSWLGGSVQLSTFSTTSGAYDTSKHPGAPSTFGVDIIRANIKYENTTIFNGYPAKRPWYSLSSDVYQEIIPSAGDAYPYSAKILLLYMGAPNYSLPAGQTNTEILSDINRVPLFIVNDITVGVTSLYADYIFPDVTYLERWEFPGSHPNIIYKVQPVRSPVAPPLVDTVRVFGQEMPLSLEAMLLGLAEKANLPGFGADGFERGIDLKHPDDLYIRQVANIAVSAKVPDASEADVELFTRSHRHLPAGVFDVVRWEKLAGKDWKKVVNVLNHGGAFQAFEEGMKGNVAGWIKNTYSKSGQNLINVYQEKTASTKNAITGKSFKGLPVLMPITDSMGNELRFDAEYSLQLITQRDIMQTKSRTNVNYWMLAMLPENQIIIHEQDALRLGLKNGDLVKVVSPTNVEGEWDLQAAGKKPMTGKVKVTQTISPGVATFVLGFGNWANGSRDVVIDGKTIKGDARRGAGVHANAAMLIDPYLKNTCLSDLAGGSAVFYDTKVKLVKV